MAGIYRGFDPEHDEPINGWSDEAISLSLQYGKTLVVDEHGDVYEYIDGDIGEYIGRIRRCL